MPFWPVSLGVKAICALPSHNSKITLTYLLITYSCTYCGILVSALQEQLDQKIVHQSKPVIDSRIYPVSISVSTDQRRKSTKTPNTSTLNNQNLKRFLPYLASRANRKKKLNNRRYHLLPTKIKKINKNRKL